MPKLVTVTMTLAEARALRGRADAGLEEAWYMEPDGRQVRLLPPATWAAAERAIDRLDAAIAESEGTRS